MRCSIKACKFYMGPHRRQGRRYFSLAARLYTAGTWPRATFEGVHVLVVEDTDDSRDLLKAALEYCGALVTTASSAKCIAVKAAELKDKVKIEVSSVGLHPGMEPGLYVCASNHLHIKGTVQNLGDVALGRIKVGGKALDGEGSCWERRRL